jgi:ribosomal protein S18 acetylase RimI-like enzyme
MYSHEAGGITQWIDELYVLEEYRSKGLGREFFSYLQANFDKSVVRLRLEVESKNERAIKFYKSIGFDILEYGQMFKDL